MRPRFADFELTAIGLFAGALLFVLSGIVTNRGDITSATLVLSGVACLVTGLYLLSFSQGESFDPQVAALLSVQGTIDISALCADLGAGGNGYILPTKAGSPVHFIPVADFNPPLLEEGRIFLIDGEGGHGIALTPAGLPLFSTLEKDHALTIPTDEPGMLALLEEVGLEVFSLAGSVRAVRSGENVVVEMGQFRLAAGCRAIRQISSKCCSVYPCPVCSLFACLLSRGMGKAVTLEKALLEGSTLHLIYSFAPQPTSEDRDSSR